MKRLNIGVICYPTVGGSGVVATELGKKMAARGHSVHFITSERPFRLTQLSDNVQFHRVEIEGYSVFQYPPYDIALANRIAQVIQSEALDVLHVHYAVPHAIAATLGRHMADSSIPIVTTLHGTDVTILGEQVSLKDTVRYGIEQSDRTTAVSEALRRDTYRLIAPDAPIDVIYNFIDHEAYYVDDEERDSVRREFGFDEKELVFIHVSNFREVKRRDYVLNSFAHILQEKWTRLTSNCVISELSRTFILLENGPTFARYLMRVTSCCTYPIKRRSASSFSRRLLVVSRSLERMSVAFQK